VIAEIFPTLHLVSRQRCRERCSRIPRRDNRRHRIAPIVYQRAPRLCGGREQRANGPRIAELPHARMRASQRNLMTGVPETMAQIRARGGTEARFPHDRLPQFVRAICPRTDGNKKNSLASFIAIMNGRRNCRLIR